MNEHRGTLPTRIVAHFDSLPAKQRVVARAFADEPEALVYSSVEAFGRRIGVDAATVVRTCQNLGFTGWSQVRDEVRRSLGQRRTFEERARALTTADDEIVADIFNTGAANVTRTYDCLERSEFDAAADVLHRADMVAVVADGVSQGAGVFLSSSLQIVGVHSMLAAGTGQTGSLLSSLREDDALVAISVWRYLRSTVQAVEIARDHGIKVVAVTDSVVAPVARAADHVLLARTESVGPRLSLAGVMVLLEALVARVAATEPDRTRQATHRANLLYYDGNVLGGPARPGGSPDGDEQPDNVRDGAERAPDQVDE